MSNCVTTEPKKVIVIPATKSLHPERDGVEPLREKKRVAAYCRVSTTFEEQQGSYNLQKKYFETMIKNNPSWEFAGIYGDEGKSGTSLKGRTGFLMMMDDVRAGKIDYIIAKATSRFGRNTSEFIAVMDELDSYGVEVLFESEGILTSGQQNRVMLQMMGVTNEHYSSTLSNNVRWSKERNMKKGQVTFCYKQFLGYEKGEDGKPRIVEEEAKIVRQIYEMFLEGNTYKSIAVYLTEQGIPSPTGKTEWRGATVKSILTNEKYSGDALLQKTFKRNYLEKRAHKNNGEKPQVFVENNHPAIIDKATFARVQELVKKRNNRRNAGTSESPFVGRVVCADCGEYFGRKTWTSRGRIKYTMWVCNHKYTDETSYTDDKCKTANLRQEWIEQGYLYTINQLLARKTQILGKYGRKLKRVENRLSSGEIERAIFELVNEKKKVDEQLEALKGEWEYTFGDHSDFYRRQDELTNKNKAINQKIHTLEDERIELNTEKKLIKTFMETIEGMPDKLTRFNGKEFIGTVDRVMVSQSFLIYHFYGGESVKVNLEAIRKMN